MALPLGEHFQISYVTDDIDAATTYIVDVLGGRQLSRFTDLRGSDGGPTMLQNLSHFDLRGTEVELIQPRRPWHDSIYISDGDQEATPLRVHHLGYLSPTREAWAEVVAAAREADIDIPVLMDLPEVAVAYLDTRSALGHFIEAVYRAPSTGPGGVKDE